ncbi:cytochrome P450 4d8-like isoform X2 [Haematobia irritans]|uniref:cytochrome P450 4d8-like isoform X2 n=2 Tax=Haematobia irritans TaxID=7368 RepID=UPI003F509C49
MFFLCSLVILLIVFMVAIVELHRSKKSMRDAVRNLPGPYCFPFFGCLYMLYKINYKNILTMGEKYMQKYGETARFWGFNRLVVISMNSELCEKLLISNSHMKKHRTYDILHQWLGEGLLVSNGKKWYSRRKLITPTFHFRILEEFLEVFNLQSDTLLNCLAEKADGKTVFDIYPYMCSLTLDIITETAMGTKVNAQIDQSMSYTQAINEMTKIMAWRFLKLHLHSEVLFALIHPLKKLRQSKLIQIMHKFTHDIIEKRRNELCDQNNGQSDGDQHFYDIGTKKRMALLDVLLQAKVGDQSLTDEDIREEVETFMFEGHDTTASALSFTLHLMSRNPRTQLKALKEIQQILGNGNTKPVTLMKLNELKYLECIIKESLRLYPPVPIIAKDIIEDFPYEHSELGPGIIPAGTEVMIPLIGIMRNTKRIDRPLDFIPERHEKTDTANVFQFIPFSAGPRNCIGQKFAMNEMKLVLVKILQHYELLPFGDEVKPVVNIVLRSSTGMQLGIRKR